MDIAAFDMDTVEARRLSGSPPTCMVIGSRGKGKSWITRDLMYTVRATRKGLVVSGTEEGNDFYASFVPPVFIHTEMQISMLKSVVDRQKKVQNKTPKDDLLIVLDDCMYDRAFTRDPVMRGIFMNGRHWKVMLVLHGPAREPAHEHRLRFLDARDEPGGGRAAVQELRR